MLCFTTLSLAMETMGMRLSVVKQSFFLSPLGQHGRLVRRANMSMLQTVVMATNNLKDNHFLAIFHLVFASFSRVILGKIS